MYMYILYIYGVIINVVSLRGIAHFNRVTSTLLLP